MPNARRIVITASLLVSTLFVLPGSSAEAKPLPLTFISCGMDVSESIRVANNLVNCPGIGLRVVWGNLTIDLDGHRIGAAPDSTSYGIGLMDNAVNVTIKGGVLSGFERGVYVDGADRTTVGDMVIDDTEVGISVVEGEGHTVKDNVVARSTNGINSTSANTSISGNTVTGANGVGIYVHNTRKNKVQGNELIADYVGISFRHTDTSTISGNRVTSSISHGINASNDSFENTITKNSVVGTDDLGIFVDGGTDEKVTNNTVTGGGTVGILVENPDGGSVQGNTVSANDEHGIWIVGGTDVSVAKNVSSQNGGDGIIATGTTHDVTGNTATYNGFLNAWDDNYGLGIQTNSTGNVSKNVADHNDDTDECLGLTCKTAPEDPKLSWYQCGDDVSEDIVLANNLENCAGNGLNIIKADVDIDLNGHRIDGTQAGGSSGIDNVPGVANVTVRNGVITYFERGVYLSTGANDNVLSDLVLADNTLEGVYVVETDDTVIDHTTATRNNQDGIQLWGSTLRGTYTNNTLAANGQSGFGMGGPTRHTITLKSNRSIGNDEAGIYYSFLQDSTITKNEIVANGLHGIADLSASNVALRSNTVRGNAFNGMIVESSVYHVISKNVITGNAAAGLLIEESPNVTVKSNVASGNNYSGIHADDAGQLQLIGNTASGNAHHGILVETEPAVAKKNRADHNGHVSPFGDNLGLGIFLLEGSITSGNKAKGNDDPNECEGDFLECHVAS